MVTNISQPTFRQLEQLAQTTATPLGVLFRRRTSQEQLPVPHFRTKASELPPDPSPDLIETVSNMERRRAWLREYLVEAGVTHFPLLARLN